MAVVEASCSSVELVGFQVPEDDGRSLYISGLPAHMDIGEIGEELSTTFSRFGLVYDVHLPTSDHTPSPPTSCGYGFVKFYLQCAASRALGALDQRATIGGKLIRVQFAARRHPAPPTSRTLHYTKCQKLANHYLTYNGWSLHIVSMTACEGGGYECSVQLELRPCERVSVGIGRGSPVVNDSLSQARAIGAAKKMAYHRACEDAFSKVVMAVLPNGKALPSVCSSPSFHPSTDTHTTHTGGQTSS